MFCIFVIDFFHTMQKLFVSFLSVVYLVLTAGFTQYEHTCKAMAVKMYSLTNAESRSDKPCPICAAKENGLKEKKKDCCKYDSRILKVDDSIQKKLGFDFSVKFWGEAIPNNMLGAVFDYACHTSEDRKATPHLFSRIPIRDNPLYILHCVYRI